MGLWWADGSCGIYTWSTIEKRESRPKAYKFNRTNYQWYISNSNLTVLEKAKLILENIYGKVFKII